MSFEVRSSPLLHFTPSWIVNVASFLSLSIWSFTGASSSSNLYFRASSTGNVLPNTVSVITPSALFACNTGWYKPTNGLLVKIPYLNVASFTTSPLLSADTLKSTFGLVAVFSLFCELDPHPDNIIDSANTGLNTFKNVFCFIIFLLKNSVNIY